jgi:uncharacterized membrane protein (UPF0127 family)
MRRFIAAAVLVAATLLIAGVASAAAPPASPAAPVWRDGKGTLHIIQENRRATLSVDIVTTFESRARGLMYRRVLPEDAGMLFVFEDDGTGGFWMKNTLIPLSIAFVDKTWHIVDIKDMKVAPDPENGPFDIYAPSKPYRYALEVNQGYFARKGISAGARLELVLAK